MINQTVSKTYRVPIVTVEKIEAFAMNQKLNQSKAIHLLIDIAMRSIEERQLERELDDLSKDTHWLTENETWAEHNLM